MKKPTRELLEQFVRTHYLEVDVGDGAPDTMHSAIRDCVTDLCHIHSKLTIEQNPTMQSVSDMLDGALDVFEEETSVCKKCGSPLDSMGLCMDETCPYSDHGQNAKLEDLYREGC